MQKVNLFIALVCFVVFVADAEPTRKRRQLQPMEKMPPALREKIQGKLTLPAPIPLNERFRRYLEPSRLLKGLPGASIKPKKGQTLKREIAAGRAPRTKREELDRKMKF